MDSGWRAGKDQMMVNGVVICEILNEAPRVFGKDRRSCGRTKRDNYTIRGILGVDRASTVKVKMRGERSNGNGVLGDLSWRSLTPF